MGPGQEPYRGDTALRKLCLRQTKIVLITNPLNHQPGTLISCYNPASLSGIMR